MIVFDEVLRDGTAEHRTSAGVLCCGTVNGSGQQIEEMDSSIGCQVDSAQQVCCQGYTVNRGQKRGRRSTAVFPDNSKCRDNAVAIRSHSSKSRIRLQLSTSRSLQYGISGLSLAALDDSCRRRGRCKAVVYSAAIILGIDQLTCGHVARTSPKQSLIPELLWAISANDWPSCNSPSKCNCSLVFGLALPKTRRRASAAHWGRRESGHAGSATLHKSAFVCSVLHKSARLPRLLLRMAGLLGEKRWVGIDLGGDRTTTVLQSGELHVRG